MRGKESTAYWKWHSNVARGSDSRHVQSYLPKQRQTNDLDRGSKDPQGVASQIINDDSVLILP